MPADNTLQLVIQVEADKANNSIKNVNASLSSLEPTAVSAARGASQGVDGLTASVAKGAAAGTLLAHAFEKVVAWVKEYTLEAAKLAARNETLAVVNQQLARANGYNGDAIERLVARQIFRRRGVARTPVPALLGSLELAPCGPLRPEALPGGTRLRPAV